MRWWSSRAGRRCGSSWTAALALGTRTTLRAGYERFEDERTADRGIPSFEGRPCRAPITTYFGAVAAGQRRELFDATYYGTSPGNNNIMPGASRTLRFSLSTGR